MSKLPAFVPAKVETTSPIKASLTRSAEALALGLRSHRVLGRKGDLVVILTDAKIQGGKQEPCLVLANQRDPRERHVYIPLSQIWHILEPQFMARSARLLAKQLYGHVTKDDCFRITDALYDYADDLISAPPPAKASTRQWMDALATDGWTLHKDGQALNS